MDIQSAFAPFWNPRIGVSFSPLNLLRFALIFTVFTQKSASVPQDFTEIPYSQYCKDFVPESPLAEPHHTPDNFLRLDKAVYSLGFENSRFNFDPSFPQIASFSTRNVYATKSRGILKFNAFLNLVGPGIVGYFSGNIPRRKLRLVQVRSPRFQPHVDVGAGFRLFGFWDSHSGKLCMVGSGSVSSLRSLNVVFKFNYPNSSVLDTSLVNGTLQSIMPAGSVAYFKPVSILGVSRMGYNYSYIDKEIENGGFSIYDFMRNLSLSLPDARSVYGRGICSIITWGLRFELDYDGFDCKNVSCGFVTVGNEMLPRYMSIKVVDCLEEGMVRYILQFSNSSYAKGLPFYPRTSLVAEGAWDGDKKRLALVACQVLDEMPLGSDGRCLIRLAFSLPSILSLRNRSSIVGEMWSTKNKRLGRVSLHSPTNLNSRIKDTSYEYTQHENVKKFCTKKLSKVTRGTYYPGEKSPNLRFDMTVRNKKGQIAYGYASPMFVGDKFYSPFTKSSIESKSSSEANRKTMNVSYVMSFKNFGSKAHASEMVEISAEGTYNTRNGVVCMIGCRHLPLGKLDCELAIDVNYSPMNGETAGKVQGSISSLRKNSDPLHFDRLEFVSSSITTLQARESIWRMDLEITMVLISNTLACIFVGLQLFHVKKHPETLPFISVVMLVVLTLAHMIPLLLNFEAVFLANRNRNQNVTLGTDQWLEVHEVLVRVITMVAFLLQFRLLQLTWSSRTNDESQTALWVSDKKVLYLSLPLYIAGGLTAWFAHSLQRTHTRRFTAHDLRPQRVTFWGELKSYVGLVLDAFLLPQITFNLFCDAHEAALAPPFYVGSTVVRLLPHTYDLYRTHSSSWSFDKIYANPRMDYYSTMWDVVVCCGGAACAAVVYLQQRFGGRCVLPRRFRGRDLYEKVPVSTTSERNGL